MARLAFLGCFALALASLPVPAAAVVESVQSLVEAEIAKLGEAGGFWGVSVEELDSGRPIVAINSRTLMLPASNRKLFSTALALRRLGPDHRFATRLWAVGPIDENGTLQGDLILEAGGDPTLRPAFRNGASGYGLLGQWARTAAEAGIARVEGRVLLDTSIYLDPALMPPGWGWDQLINLYATLPSALAINENRVVVTITPGRRVGDPCLLETSLPSTAGHSLINSTRTAEASGRNTLRLMRSPGPAALLLVGELPLGASPVSLTVPLPDPVAAYAEALDRALDRAGIETAEPTEITRRRAAPDTAGDGVRLLVVHRSPTVTDIVRRTNKDSDNQCAEMLFLAAGARAHGQASYPSAQAAESQMLRALRVNTDWVQGEDGSGLARTDLIAPGAIVQLLRAMADSPEREPFLDSLPVSGRDGTLRYRMSRDGLAGKIRAKTGTLRDVCALSGYIEREDGRTLAFALVANHYSTRTASIRAAQDRLCAILFRARLD